MMQAQPADRLGESPAVLIRTIDGHITFWSPAMEQRYGFTADSAIGQQTHQLLRTISWRAMDELNANLAKEGMWRGGLIHSRTDDQPVITANHWLLHRGDARGAALVTELHSDIVPIGTHTADDLADVITAVAQELSQPLEAISGYVGGVRLLLDKPWLNRAQLDKAIAQAVYQLARAGAIASKMRALGAGLRDPRLVQLHHKLTTTMDETHLLAEHAHDLINAASTRRAERERRKRGSSDDHQ